MNTETSLSFRQLIEKTSDKIIYVEGELWVTYGQSSGQTVQLPDLTKYLNSDNTDKDHYDSLVPKILKFSKDNKPLMKNKSGNVKMFEVPMYPITRNEKYDIWGGNVTPVGKIYMIVTEEKSTIVNFFKSKNEATNWIKSIS